VCSIAAAAHKMGIAGLVVPDSNVQEAAVVEGLAVYGFKYLSEVADSEQARALSAGRWRAQI